MATRPEGVMNWVPFGQVKNKPLMLGGPTEEWGFEIAESRSTECPFFGCAYGAIAESWTRLLRACGEVSAMNATGYLQFVGKDGDNLPVAGGLRLKRGDVEGGLGYRRDELVAFDA